MGASCDGQSEGNDIEWAAVMTRGWSQLGQRLRRKKGVVSYQYVIWV